MAVGDMHVSVKCEFVSVDCYYHASLNYAVMLTRASRRDEGEAGGSVDTTYSTYNG